MKLSTKKLDEALERLEMVIDGLLDRSSNPAATAREVELLNQDRARLGEELDAALSREKELQSLADEASEALGSAIDEVRAAIVDKESSPNEGPDNAES